MSTVLSLRGGLGNQLFQWALAVALQENGHRIVFDTVRLRGERPLAIGPLLDSFPRLSRPVGLGLVALDKAGVLDRVPGLRVVREPSFGYVSNLDSLLGSRNYLLGYWQSPRYFASSAAQIRDQVTAFGRSTLTPEGQALLADVTSAGDVAAVHVRRGDYVTNPVAAAHHGTLDDDYYTLATKQLREAGANRFLYFSDDLDWVRAHLAQPDDVLVPRTVATEPIGEIALMAACAGRVIANSSFSWWAAYLADDGSAALPTVAPSQWFADNHADAGDLVPSTWTRL